MWGSVYLFSIMEEGERSVLHTDRFTIEERIWDTRRIGSIRGLDALEKRKIFYSYWESNPVSSIIQPVA
jgi:hypothetical protein